MSGISIKNVGLHYKSNPKPTLVNMNMNIPKGVIYGLLGPSGCGKTSILRCVLGRIKPNKGKISVFGNKPGSQKSQIPGIGVGYMPQEIALYNEFTIEETINYFATIFGLSKSLQKSRLETLLKFLDLPDKNKFVKHLSGGQKRRVSIASTLVHKPPLLILDEPTVGVDPLLRESIWKHLYDLTQLEQMTVIITTHYIEEAKLANVIGLMRNGTLLVEDHPDDLLKRYSSSSLENVFLKICHLQMHHNTGLDNKEDNDTNNNSSSINEETALIVKCHTPINLKKNPHLAPPRLVKTNSIFDMNEVQSSPVKKSPTFLNSFYDHYNKFQSQVKKSLVKTQRNLGLIFFQLMLPAITMFFFCYCIGNIPENINLAVFNGEVNYYNFSHAFLESLKNKSIDLKYYDTEEEAIESVREGKNQGALIVNANYSYSLKNRFEYYYQISNESLRQSKIKYFADQTEMPIQLTLTKNLLNSLVEFFPKIAKVIFAELEPVVLSTPLLENEKPIYGDENPSFRDYVAPSLILAITFALSVGLTALSFVKDRNEGILERSFVSGVRSIHIFLAHFVIEFFMMMIQTLIMLFFMFYLFNINLNGSLILVILLTIVQGVCGMSLGMLISSICEDEQSAIMLSIGMFYPTLITSGIIWPVEAMPRYLSKIVYVLPQTYAVKSIRSIITKGWDFTYPDVNIGFGITLIWILIFNSLALRIFSKKC